MRRFDEVCLMPVRPLSAEEIRALREREGALGVLGRWLNVLTSVLSQWGRGNRHPHGASRELLWLLERHGIETVAQ